MANELDALIAAPLVRLATARGSGKSICPSDAARAVAIARTDVEWRQLMPRVDAIVERLAKQGRVFILQRGVDQGTRFPRDVYRVRIVRSASS